MNLNHFITIVSIFLASLFLTACTASKSAQKDKDSAADLQANLLIYIQQSRCMGKCPDYEASLYTGKKMVYEGRKHMPVIGRYEYLLPADLAKNLIYEAVKMNVKLVPDSISIPPDVPVTHLSVVINGKMKKMVGWVGSGNDSFDKYVKLVYTEVRNMISDQEGVKIP